MQTTIWTTSEQNIFIHFSRRIVSHLFTFSLFPSLQTNTITTRQSTVAKNSTTRNNNDLDYYVLFCCDFSAIILLHFYYPTTVIVENLLICTRKHAAHCLLTKNERLDGPFRRKNSLKNWRKKSNLFLQSLKWSILCIKKEAYTDIRMMLLLMLPCLIPFFIKRFKPYPIASCNIFTHKNVHSHWLDCSFDIAGMCAVDTLFYIIIMIIKSYPPTSSAVLCTYTAHFHFYCHHICCVDKALVFV